MINTILQESSRYTNAIRDGKMGWKIHGFYRLNRYLWFIDFFNFFQKCNQRGFINTATWPLSVWLKLFYDAVNQISKHIGSKITISNNKVMVS